MVKTIEGAVGDTGQQWEEQRKERWEQQLKEQWEATNSNEKRSEKSSGRRSGGGQWEEQLEEPF